MFLKFHSLFIMRARILNPQILLADHTVVTGPAFYDTAQRPHFFPLNAVIVNLLPFFTSNDGKTTQVYLSSLLNGK